MKKTRSILTIFLVVIMMLALFPAAAFAAGSGPTATAAVKGGDVTITVKDGDVTVTGTGQFVKNSTQTYEIDGYTVKVEYNGNGVKSATVTGSPAVSSPAVSSPGGGEKAPALVSESNAPAPKPGVNVSGGDMTWNGFDQAAAKAFTQSASKDKTPPATACVPVTSKKTDASGDKIPSNAHSGDYPGVYFYWNDKQKDDGILKVDPAVFDLFDDEWFYITAKNSNAYWDYRILPEQGVPTSEGYLLYQIPRYFMYKDKNNKEVKDELKNINMIFIGGNYKDAYLTISKDWLDEEGNLIDDEAVIEKLNGLLTFSSNAGKLGLGENVIKITDYNTAFYGKKVTVTEGALKGYATKQNPISVTVKYNDDPVKAIAFENQKQKAKITIKKDWDLLPGTTAPEARFTWGPLPYEEGAAGNEAKAGDVIEVKEGGYWFLETPIDGFTAEPGYQEITVVAGEKYTVSFKNKEDRATLTVIKVWEDEYLPDGSPVPAAEFTNGYALGTVTVKAGENIAFEEEAIQGACVMDGWAYTFVFDFVTVDGVRSDENKVDFDAAKDASHEVVFHNKWEREALPSNVTVTKTWEFGDLPEAQQAELKELLEFDANFDFTLGETAPVPAGTKLHISEAIIDWSYDASTDTQDILYTVACDEKVYKERAGRDQDYVFAFTNTVNKSVSDKPADVTVEKVWAGCFGELPAKVQSLLRDKLSFNANFEFVLGESQKIAAGEELLISEKAMKEWSYDASTATSEIIYTIVFDQSEYAWTTEPGGAMTFTFTNTVEKTVTPKKAAVEVVKIWKDAAGNLVTDQGFLGELNDMLTFTNGFWLGENVIDAGPVTIMENPINTFTYGGVDYSVTFESVTLTDPEGGQTAGNMNNSGSGVSFDAVKGESYTVTFVNVIDTAIITTGLDGGGKIPSTTHYDRWWGYGVLCYSSNTTDKTYDGKFYVAFEPGFWDKYEYAKIGFGTAGNIMFYAYFTEDSYEIQKPDGTVLDSGALGSSFTIPSSWGTHYYNGNGYMGQTLYGAWIVNPFDGSGSRQAYCLELKPLAASSIISPAIPDLLEDE